MKTLLILSVIAAVTTATSAAAEVRSARSDVVVLQTTISFSDLDLSRTAGADSLIARLRKATLKVCGDMPNRADMDAFLRYSTCRTRTMEAAIRQVNVPLVTARYARDPAQARLAAK